MKDIEPAIRATSQARALCLSLQRAFLGPRALAALRAGRTDALRPEELRVGLGLAWAAGDAALIRSTLRRLAPEAVAADPVLAALRDAAGPD